MVDRWPKNWYDKSVLQNLTFGMIFLSFSLSVCWIIFIFPSSFPEYVIVQVSNMGSEFNAVILLIIAICLLHLFIFLLAQGLTTNVLIIHALLLCIIIAVSLVTTISIHYIHEFMFIDILTVFDVIKLMCSSSITLSSIIILQVFKPRIEVLKDVNLNVIAQAVILPLSAVTLIMDINMFVVTIIGFTITAITPPFLLI